MPGSRRDKIEQVRRLGIAVVGLLAGCDALWRIDTIAPASDAAHAIDGAPPSLDARPHTGPYLHFKMDDLGLGYTSDTIGNYDAVCAPSCPDVVTGHLDNALELNSFGQVDQRLQIAAIADFAVVDQFSIAGWIQLTTLATEACPWSKPYSTGAADSWQLCINPGGAVSFITYGVGGSNQISTAAGWATLDATFHHVATVYDGATKTVYWDGDVAIQGAAGIPLVDANDVVLGNDLDGTMYVAPFNGALDELNFYSYALTPAEVAALAAQ
jgi:hypothetical protein